MVKLDHRKRNNPYRPGNQISGMTLSKEQGAVPDPHSDRQSCLWNPYNV